MHICALMNTYFFRFFEQLVHDGLVYVLETPQFRVRRVGQRVPPVSNFSGQRLEAYIFSLRQVRRLSYAGRNEPESIGVIHWQGNAVEVLGHGHRVEYAPRVESGPISNIYMGKNTPERKDYIMDKLVVPVEE